MSDSKYYTAIKKELTLLSNDPRCIILGQQCYYENFYGLLNDIPLSKRHEMPVIEELQMGMSIGLSLEGYLPISIFQRMDFLPRACDQIVNHLDLIPELSRNKFIPKVIVFTTIGSTKPLDVGLQHNKDLISGFRALLRNTPIYDLKTVEDVQQSFKLAVISKNSSILVARQDLFDE